MAKYWADPNVQFHLKLFREDFEYKAWGYEWMKEQEGLNLDQMPKFWNSGEMKEHKTLMKNDKDYR